MSKANHDTQMLADPAQAAALEADAAHWRERDLAVLWHPCTQMREHPGTLPLLPIARGEGAWLIGRDGRRYLDAISSWWTNLFGHAEPRLADAIARQARTLEHVILAGCSHAPAVELAERLLAVAPRQAGRPALAKVFYADNGSAGVEVALKMAFHWFRNRGEERRTRFVALENGYHGETIGALSVGDIPLYRRVYAPLLMEALFAPSPDAYLCEPGESPADRARRAAEALRDVLERHAGEICALILEPRLQCAGGMRMHDPLYLTLARALCDEFGVFLIADEIAVGFGRTGTLFACEQAPALGADDPRRAGPAALPRANGDLPAGEGPCPPLHAGIQPDFLCLSKGLTGGALPLAAVLTTDAVYEGFLDDSRERAFLHSHSYTGNPLACAAALASLGIFEQDDVIARNLATAATMARHAATLSDHPHVADVRQAGMVVAFELSRCGNRATPFAAAARVGLHAYRTALEHGVLLRPLGDVLYWMPPYCVDEDALAHLATTTRTAIDRAIKDSRACA